MARMALDDRRTQLVEAAITVMTREGVRRATTRAVVAEARTSLSVFHYCFDSKSALLEEVVRTIVGRTAALAREALRASAPGDDRVRAGLLAYWKHVTEHPAEHLLTYEVTQHCLRHPELEEVARTQYEHYAGVIAEHLLDGDPTAAGPELDVLARYLAVMVDGLTLDWLARRDDAQASAVLEIVADHVNALLERTRG